MSRIKPDQCAVQKYSGSTPLHAGTWTPNPESRPLSSGPFIVLSLRDLIHPPGTALRKGITVGHIGLDIQDGSAIDQIHIPKIDTVTLDPHQSACGQSDVVGMMR